MLDHKAIFAAAAVAALALWYARRQVAAVASAVNPVDPENVFHSGVNEVGAALSGDSDFSLGSWIYDVTQH